MMQQIILSENLPGEEYLNQQQDLSVPFPVV